VFEYEHFIVFTSALVGTYSYNSVN